jgi:hypothetical protein
MADINKREVKRNGRGQIVSYEIEGVFDSTNNSLQYGDVEIGVDNVMVTKYIESSFNANVDINIAELQDPNLANYKIPNPSIVMGAQITRAELPKLLTTRQMQTNLMICSFGITKKAHNHVIEKIL